MTGPLRTVEDIHSPLETFSPPSLLTMHYLVTEASQALLSVPRWMVLGAPQWPQWLASADKALNGFSGNLIAPQSPKDTTRLQLPLQSPIAAEIETEPACLPFFFPQDWPLTLSSSFWRKSTAKARKRCKEKNTQKDSWGHHRSNQSLKILLIRPSPAVIAEKKWHFDLQYSS